MWFGGGARLTRVMRDPREVQGVWRMSPSGGQVARCTG